MVPSRPGGHRLEQRSLQCFAMVSCHVEYVLDDRVWRSYRSFAAASPGGFRVAALMRPPDGPERESTGRWLDRAREAAGWGPFGLHTHFGGVESARPKAGPPSRPSDRVREEVAWLRSEGIEPRLFCGGGWYMDAEVAAVLAKLGLTDCTATRFRHAYLPAGAPRMSLATPASIEIPGARPLAEVPSTHSLRLLWRDLARRTLPDFVHLYFHDYDLRDPRRRAAISLALRLLGRSRRVADLADGPWRDGVLTVLPWAAVAAT